MTNTDVPPFNTPLVGSDFVALKTDWTAKKTWKKRKSVNDQNSSQDN